MTQAQFLADAGQRLINGVFIVSVLFPVVTTFFWAWWRSEWGWNIILLEACIAATLLPTVLLIDFGIDDIPLRWIQAVSLLLVGMVIIWRGLLIWRTQRAGNTRELESGSRYAPRAPAPPTPGMRGRFRVSLVRLALRQRPAGHRCGCLPAGLPPPRAIGSVIHAVTVREAIPSQHRLILPSLSLSISVSRLSRRTCGTVPTARRCCPGSGRACPCTSGTARTGAAAARCATRRTRARRGGE